jgi:tRNA A-37 threonylcarbamoyl transferase component Bud32
MATRPSDRRRTPKRIPAPSAPARGSASAGPLPGPAAAQAPADPLVGKVLGRCQIEAPIGQGKTARVYRAHHQALDRTVAVKVLLPSAAERPEIRENFLREARAIAQIDNENVVKIYDVVSQEGLHYIVMELLEGESVLEMVQREGRLDVMDALRIVRQAGNGLAAAHARDIVHRDVKPQNLVLLEDGTVKVVDFGLAAAGDEAGKRVGTPHYMAPEVCETGKAEARSDVYALGIVLFHLLTGQPPYAGQDISSILKAHVRGVPLQPERARPGLPKEVSELVRRLTKRDPILRPTSLEIVEELDRFGGEAVKEKGTLRRRRGRKPARVAGGAPLLIASVVVIGGIGAVIAVSTSGKEEPRPPIAAPAPPPRVVPGIGERLPPPPPPEISGSERAAQREREARSHFQGVETWARENWKGPQDDEAVINRYKRVYADYPDTEAGREADTRARMIRGKQVHPHPDRSYTAPDAVVQAREEWESIRPDVERLIAEHDYFGAREKVPTEVQDATGTFGREIRFWHATVDHLVQFRSLALTRIPELPEGDRRIETGRGSGVIVGQRGAAFEVRLDSGGDPLRVAWKEIPAKTIFEIGVRSFRAAGGGTSSVIHAMAFAFAHRLWDEFSEADFEVEFGGGAGAEAWLLKEWKERFAR